MVDSQAVRTGGPLSVGLAKYSARNCPAAQPATMVNVAAFEVWLLGLTTRTLAVPAVAVSALEMLAVRRVSLTKVVGRALPFHCTVEPETKPEPSTVSVNAGPPAAAVLGVSESTDGPLDAVPPSRTMRPTDGTPCALSTNNM